MGLMNFIKSGAAEFVVCRTEAAKDDLVYKHTDDSIPMGAQLQLSPDDWVVFFRDRAVVGVFDRAGRYTLDSKNIPWLNVLMDKVTSGSVFKAEVFFVLRREVPDGKFGGQLDPIRDPIINIRIQPMINGEYSMQVTDPTKFIVGFAGMGRKNNDQVNDFIRKMFLGVFTDRLSEFCAKEKKSLLDGAGAMKLELMDEVLPHVNQRMERYGVAIGQIMDFRIRLSPEDQQRYDGISDKIGAAQADVAVAQAQAQARRAQIQVDLERDAAYSQMAGGFGQYADARMKLGAGEGMAKGGEGAGAAMAGVGLGAGVAMGAQFVQGAAAGARPGAPGVVPAGVTPMAVPGALVACPACRAEVVQAKFCAECGAAMAPQKRTCGKCSVEVAAGVKFCPECGNAMK